MLLKPRCCLRFLLLSGAMQRVLQLEEQLAAARAAASAVLSGP
jgi:hypothetical protein